MNEYENYEDILQGDFKENDANANILKTLMGWKWLTQNCDSSNIKSAKNTSSILTLFIFHIFLIFCTMQGYLILRILNKPAPIEFRTIQICFK